MRNDVNALLTLRDFLRYAVTQFGQSGIWCGHGATSVYDEAVWLLTGVLKIPNEQAEFFFDCRLLDAEKKTLSELIYKRCHNKIPTAYLIQEAWLHGYRFFVNEQVIIPRSYIAEILLDDLLHPWLNNRPPERILDLCTGSGCLAILAAIHYTGAKVHAVDISEAALTVCDKNIADYHLSLRVHSTCADLFNKCGKLNYDLIIANPPYVDAEAMRQLPAEYRHEPSLALAAGEDGLEVVRRILAEAAHYLTDQGLLVVEIGQQKQRVEEAFPQLPFVWLETSAGNEEVFLLTKADLI